MSLKVLSILCVLVALMPLGLGAEDLPNYEQVALDHVRASENYIDNGGFNETIVGAMSDGDTTTVIVEYCTRHVGMLQVIGHFISHVTMNSTTLEVIRSWTEETHEKPMPVPETDPGTGNWTDPDPEPGDPDEGYRLKILITINTTRARILEAKAEEDLSEALNMLDRAEELVDRGEYDPAAELAVRAEELTAQYLTGGEEPGEEPGEDPGSDMPWLQGYVVVFAHEPTTEDWEELQTLFNATYNGDVSGIAEKGHAYWVRVSGFTPDDLATLDGVSEVLALRGNPEEPEGPQGGGDDIPELPVLSLLACLGLLAGGRPHFADPLTK